ncbi:hypothetical protein AAFN47_26725 [Hoeflea sp. CAU 1731]
MTGGVAPALDRDALYAKSKLYIRKALVRKVSEELDEYQLWASLALELLGKSALASHHPSLVADPNHYQSMFAASGINLSTDVKTITAKTLYARLRHLIPRFDEKNKEFCDQIALRRNAELHSGATPFSAMSLDAWESNFWYACETILAYMESDLESWLGIADSSAPKAILEASKAARRQSVELRVQRHREDFSVRKKSERDAALAEAESKEAYQYRNLFTRLLEEEWPLECPACHGKAFLAGIQIGEDVVDTQPDGYTVWETVEKDLSAEEFKCPVCKLGLDGTDELEYAGIDIYHTLSVEREMEFEPDYGND